MPEHKTKEVIDPDHKIAQIINRVSSNVQRMANHAELSQWEIAMIFANVCGQILASHKDMSRDKALERIDSLQEIMVGAYDLYDIEGGKQ